MRPGCGRWDIPKRNELLGAGGQKGLLHLDAAHVAGDIGRAVAAQTHALVTVQQLVARLEVDIEILRGVLIVHSKRDVEVHAAHSVDRFDESVQPDHGVAVHTFFRSW